MYTIMKTILILSLILCATIITKAQYNKVNLKLDPVAAQRNYRFQNLQFYPIRANANFVAQHKNLGKFVTLKEALEKKKVALTESNGGEVNRLFIENISRDTIIILSGEVVQGGKQDRMIAQDFILYPKSGKKDVS